MQTETHSAKTGWRMAQKGKPGSAQHENQSACAVKMGNWVTRGMKMEENQAACDVKTGWYTARKPGGAGHKNPGWAQKPGAAWCKNGGKLGGARHENGGNPSCMWCENQVVHGVKTGQYTA